MYNNVCNNVCTEINEFEMPEIKVFKFKYKNLNFTQTIVYIPTADAVV